MAWRNPSRTLNSKSLLESSGSVIYFMCLARPSRGSRYFCLQPSSFGLFACMQEIRLCNFTGQWDFLGFSIFVFIQILVKIIFSVIFEYLFYFSLIMFCNYTRSVMYSKFSIPRISEFWE